MLTLHRVLLLTHICSGMFSLVAFYIPLLTRKGGRAHTRAGWCYVAGMAVAVGTALVLALLMLAAPETVHPPAAGADPEAHAGRLRSYGIFFVYLALLTTAAVWSGLRALRLRRHPEALRTPFGMGLQAAVGLSALVILGMGVVRRDPVFLALSLLGVFGTIDAIGVARNPAKKGRGTWLYTHIDSMIGSGVAAHTAFLLFGASRLYPAFFAAGWGWILWLVPAAIGVPVITLFIRHYRRKYGDVPGVSEAPRGEPVARQ